MSPTRPGPTPFEAQELRDSLRQGDLTKDALMGLLARADVLQAISWVLGENTVPPRLIRSVFMDPGQVRVEVARITENGDRIVSEDGDILCDTLVFGIGG